MTRTGLGARRRLFVVIAAVGVAATGVGFGASLLVRSPSQAAADTKPPKPSVLTAPVQRKVLAQTVAVRGTVVAAQSLEVVVTSERPVITAVDKSVGDEVAEGDVLLAVSGRPVVALGGSVPAYRDLRPGLDGPDVRQLQDALVRLGYLRAQYADGTFGAQTKTAVTRLYQDRGFAAVTTGDLDPAESATMGAARSAVTDAQRAVTTARLVATGPEATAQDQLELGYAQADLATANTALASLEASSGPMVPAAEVLFVPSWPAHVAASTASVGGRPDAATAGGSVMTLQTGELAVRTVISQGNAALVHEGQTAQVSDDIAGRTAEATVSQVGPFTTADPATGDSADGHPTTLTTTEALGGEWLGRDVRVVITVSQADSEQLVVPVAAITSDSDGSSYVTCWFADGTTRRVSVQVGMIADGEVAVTAAGGDVLDEGDRVVVG